MPSIQLHDAPLDLVTTELAFNGFACNFDERSTQSRDDRRETGLPQIKRPSDVDTSTCTPCAVGSYSNIDTPYEECLLCPKGNELQVYKITCYCT